MTELRDYVKEAREFLYSDRPPSEASAGASALALLACEAQLRRIADAMERANDSSNVGGLLASIHEDSPPKEHKP